MDIFEMLLALKNISLEGLNPAQLAELQEALRIATTKVRVARWQQESILHHHQTAGK